MEYSPGVGELIVTMPLQMRISRLEPVVQSWAEGTVTLADAVGHLDALETADTPSCCKRPVVPPSAQVARSTA
jgi:hypothetical protein